MEENISGKVTNLLGGFVQVSDDYDCLIPLTMPKAQHRANRTSERTEVRTEEVLTTFDHAIRKVTTQLSLYRNFGVREEKERFEEQLDAKLRRTLRHIDGIDEVTVKLQDSFREAYYPTYRRIQDLKTVAENVGKMRDAVVELAKTGTKLGNAQKEAEVADDLCGIAVSVQKLWKLYVDSKSEKCLLQKKLDEMEKKLDWSKTLTYYMSMPFLLPMWLASSVVRQAFLGAQKFVEHIVHGNNPAYVESGSSSGPTIGETRDSAAETGPGLNDTLKSSAGRVDNVFISTSKPTGASKLPNNTEASGAYMQQPIFDTSQNDTVDSGISTTFESNVSRSPFTSADEIENTPLGCTVDQVLLLNHSNERLKPAPKYGSRQITYKKNVIIRLFVYIVAILVAIVVFYYWCSFYSSTIGPGPPISILNVICGFLYNYITLRHVGQVPI